MSTTNVEATLLDCNLNPQVSGFMLRNVGTRTETSTENITHSFYTQLLQSCVKMIQLTISTAEATTQSMNGS